MSTNTLISIPRGRATRVIAAASVEVSIAAGALAFLAAAVSAMASDWRLGIAVIVTLSIVIVLSVDAAMHRGSQVDPEPDAIERLLRDNEATYPVVPIGFQVGWDRFSRGVAALRPRR